MEHQMRVVFNLPAELMADYAMMQARIKKRQSIEWERFAKYVTAHYEPSEDMDEDEEKQAAEPEQSLVHPVELEAPDVEPVVCTLGEDEPVFCKVESGEPTADELPPLVETTVADNGSESGKRTVVRWCQDEDEYLRELMKRFDNDFAMVAREMKTRNTRQCKSRWDLLNRPADETGKKKRTKKTEEDATAEQ